MIKLIKKEFAKECVVGYQHNDEVLWMSTIVSDKKRAHILSNNPVNYLSVFYNNSAIDDSNVVSNKNRMEYGRGARNWHLYKVHYNTYIEMIIFSYANKECIDPVGLFRMIIKKDLGSNPILEANVVMNNVDGSLFFGDLI